MNNFLTTAFVFIALFWGITKDKDFKFLRYKYRSLHLAIILVIITLIILTRWNVLGFDLLNYLKGMAGG